MKSSFGQAEAGDHLETAEQISIIEARYVLASSLAVDKRVLEVGCGNGLGANHLAQAAQSYIGGDVHRSNVTLANSMNQSDAKFVVMDAHNMPFKRNSFDLILLLEVIYYFEDFELVLEECKGLLAVGGILLISAPNPSIRDFRGSMMSTKYYTVGDLESLLAKQFSGIQFLGGFPLSEGLINDFVRSSRKILASLLNRIPFGNNLKTCVNRYVLGKNLSVEENLSWSDPDIGHLISIDHRRPDRVHKVIYAIANN